jgi:organic hydroperoxide reductase OsmC/OhrA
MTPSQRIISTAEAYVAGMRAEQHGGVPAAGRRWELAAELAITLPAVKDPAVAEALVSEAHRTCPFSNATRGNIGVALTVNGRGVETTAEAVAA